MSKYLLGFAQCHVHALNLVCLDQCCADVLIVGIEKSGNGLHFELTLSKLKNKDMDTIVNCH